MPRGVFDQRLLCKGRSPRTRSLCCDCLDPVASFLTNKNIKFDPQSPTMSLTGVPSVMGREVCSKWQFLVSISKARVLWKVAGDCCTTPVKWTRDVRENTRR